MTEEFLATLADKYAKYVMSFATADGVLPAMMVLKRLHTAKVVENARLIAQGEKFAEPVQRLCVAAALLHDTGRYEQLKRYDTFRDSDSVDHAVFSHDIVKELGWLDELPLTERETIMQAVLVHNRREIPAEITDDIMLKVARTVRDADKLDIFRVLEEQVANTDWRNDNKAFWNLSTTGAPSKEIIAAIRVAQPVDYQYIRTLADFVLIQVGWMVAGLEFTTSRKLCVQRKHLEFRREFFKQLTNDEAVTEICDLAQKNLDNF